VKLCHIALYLKYTNAKLTKEVIMAKYMYRGFEVFYRIDESKNDKNLFGSYGYVRKPGSSEYPLAKFHTDCPSKVEVQAEIKRLIENYVDFEWRQFNAMER
jgi:hypothetical protein